MEDEKYVFFQDVREKKVTGYSARKQRSHCGKGGRVKFPSDYLTKKELKNMSGECKSYRLNSPMTWKEFKSMPEDLQIAYIKAIKEKYNPPVTAIAKMMDADRANFSRYLINLGFEKQKRGSHPWDKMGFAEWCFGVPKTEDSQSVQEEVKDDISVEEAEEIMDLIGEEIAPNPCDEQEGIPGSYVEATPVEYPLKEQIKALCDEVIKDSANVYAIPETGSMTFTGNATQIMNTLVNLLGNAKVVLSVNWDVVED